MVSDMAFHYSIIQLQPEPHREERINIGILLWNEGIDGATETYVILPEYGFYRTKYSYPWVGTHTFRSSILREITSFVKSSQPHLLSYVYAHANLCSVYTKTFYRQPMPIVLREGQEVDDIVELLLEQFIYVSGISPATAKII